MSQDDFISTNQNHWDKRVAIHAKSEMYDVEGFLNGTTSLRHIELKELESKIEGKKVLHLQCHFGLDSFSLERLGAKVTAVDFSSEALRKADELRSKLNSNVSFILSDIMKLKDHLSGKFDLVFTSYGTLVWLPDIAKWGDIIDHFLIPGGEFFMIDFHPVMYMLDDEFDQLHYEYFRKKVPFYSKSQGTYTNAEAPIESEEYFWNQGISEIMRPFLEKDYRLINFKEYDYSTYNCFPGMEKIGDQKYVFTKHRSAVPYLYLMRWEKKSP